MRYFLDTEFNDNVDPVGLISIGIAADDGREFYAINEIYAEKKSTDPAVQSCNEWVRINVLPHLTDADVIADLALKSESFSYLIDSLGNIRNELQDFVGNDPFPEFWAYYGHYDWYLVTRLWKSFLYLPKRWPTACYDLHQFAKHSGCHKSLPKKLLPQHNALVDARWTKLAFQHVLNLPNKERKWP